MRLLKKDEHACHGFGCEAKDKCIRHLGNAVYLFQPLFNKTPGTDENCPQYIDNGL